MRLDNRVSFVRAAFQEVTSRLHKPHTDGNVEKLFNSREGMTDRIDSQNINEDMSTLDVAKNWIPRVAVTRLDTRT